VARGGFYIVDEAAAVWSRASASSPRPQPGRAGTSVPRRDGRAVDFSQVKTIEIGYRNSPKNKVDEGALMLTDENIIDIQFAVSTTSRARRTTCSRFARPA
jgi:hypothetical protein